MFLSFSFPSQPLDCTQTCLLSPPLYVAPMNRLGWRNEQSGGRERERTSGAEESGRARELSEAVARTTTHSTDTQKKRCKQTDANTTQRQSKTPLVTEI